ncbi:MAG TPA: hypothetical protein VFQ88_12940 [Nevskiaceae bacterium]|nr:hypothetical protein [Nevskiaceae bacterium]
MKFHDEFSPRPLIHAHLYVIAKKIRASFSKTATQEFWHLPTNAVEPESRVPLDWVLAEVVVSRGKMLEHRPLVAVTYDPEAGVPTTDGTNVGMCTVRAGPRTNPDEALKAVLNYFRQHKTGVSRAKYLTLPDYQRRLTPFLKTCELAALNEVALSAVGQLTDPLRQSIRAQIQARHNVILDHIPGARRFDLVVVTPPPMCFALAAIEIDGSTHGHEEWGDWIKEEFCRSTGLPLIRIGIGSRLSPLTNENQDDFQELFANWITRTVSGLDVDAQLMQFFLEAIRAVAEGAAPDVRSDLLALTDTSVSISARLSRFVAKTYSDESPASPEEEPQWTADDEYDYEASMVMVPTDERRLPNLTRIRVSPKRDGNLLFFSVDSAWTGAARIASQWEELPPLKSVGPFSIRLIASDAVRNKFFHVATDALATIAGEIVEDRTRSLLGIVSTDDYWRVRERWKLLTKLSQCLDDLNLLEKVLVKYLGEIPVGRWGEVPLIAAERAKARANREPRERDLDIIFRVQRKLVPGGKEPMVSAPRAVCEREWGWRRRHFATKAVVVRQVIEDKRLPIADDVRELLISLVEEREAVWDKFDEWLS